MQNAPHKPSFGEANLSALIAGVISSIGGLFSLGLVPAIVYHAPELLVRWPKLDMFCFFLSGTVGWLLGGQLGPRLHKILGERKCLIIGGVIGGILPVIGIIVAGWYFGTG